MKVVVSGDNSLRELENLRPGREIRLDEAGPLCVRGGEFFCASDWNDMIWRLDAGLLVPTGLFSGGPGMSALCVSPCGKRLYALCAEADSVLMLCAYSGAPMIVCRAGVNPASMTQDETGKTLCVAGGASGETLLLNATTLECESALPMPGAVCCCAMNGGWVYSLCLDERLDSVLVACFRGVEMNRVMLCGSPGAMLCKGETLLAATSGNLYALSSDGGRVLRRWDAPGRASRLLVVGDEVLYCDQLGEALFAFSRRSGRWRCLMRGARDFAAVAERD